MAEHSPIFDSLPSDSQVNAKSADKRRVVKVLYYLQERNVLDAKTSEILAMRARRASKVGELFEILGELPEGSSEALGSYAVKSSPQAPNKKVWLVVDIVTVAAAVFLLMSVSGASSAARQFAEFLVVVAVALMVVRNIMFRRKS